MSNNANKQLWIFLGILVISVSFFVFFNNSVPADSGDNNSASTGSLEVQKISVLGTEMKVEVAKTEAQRQQGLSGHKRLRAQEGMIFLFENPGQYGIWMKDMAFPIDILWLASADDMGMTSIVHIEKNVSPDTYPKVFTPSEQAQYVLEVAAGTANRYRWSEGDKVEFLMQ